MITIDRRQLLTRAAGIATAATVATVAGTLAVSPAHAALTPLTSVQIPRLKLSRAVYSGTSKAVLDTGGFGHWLGTGQPGKNGNCILFAHRTSAGGPLRAVQTLVVGDKITLAGKVYTVQKKLVLPVAQIRTAINWTPGKRPGLSLVTCSRLDGLPTSLAYRYVVHAVA